MPNEKRLEALLPVSIAGDEKIKAAARACDSELAEIDRNINAVYILSRIDELPEPVLDLLAWQFHVEGYDLARTVEEKRALVKSAIELHRYKGTRWAIQKVLEALNLHGEVKEWFEYAGEPYRFKVDLGIQDKEITPELRDKLRKFINEYKNERSHLEEILLSYFTASVLPFAIGQTAETETFAGNQTDLEWTATGSVFFAVSTFAEVQAVAVMEAL